MNGDLLGTVLWPFKWAIDAVLVTCHSLLVALGLAAGDGVTWLLAVLGLMIVVRVLLTPLFVRQVNSQRKMALLAPQLQNIQQRYKGQTDRLSREAMNRDTMALYRAAGTSPFASCLPILVQLPILLSVFQVLSTAMRSLGSPGVAFLTAALASSFSQASLFGAPLRITLLTTGAPPTAFLIGVLLIAVTAASQFLSQVLNQRATVPPGALGPGPQGAQKALLYLLPVIVVASNLTFPLGVIAYWTFSSLWTLGQTFLITARTPPQVRENPSQ